MLEPLPLSKVKLGDMLADYTTAPETRSVSLRLSHSELESGVDANVHHLLLPRQAKVLEALQSIPADQRLTYLLTAGFLGRLSLSGEIAALTPAQLALVNEAIQFYEHLTPLIARGTSLMFQQVGPNPQHLQGAQALCRLARDKRSAIVVLHSFGAPLPTEIRVPLPGRDWQLASRFPEAAPLPIIEGSDLCWWPFQEWQGAVLYLERGE